ncbi:6-phosphogluconolactonase [Desulfovibrio sp. TomC]|uniref:6-phosphogluconolactonase n=1 Tax=Desulfovibrio sp. TomC TaxID=1562888 RepID=UPI00057462C6|nr:6-phosphogluconolactonase [Desulfovibrio sp. TomC]KHK02688.1 6-phosphogluconolactonase [Desulfovibrio sp. TomC]
MTAVVRRFPDAAALTEAALTLVTVLARAAWAARGRFTLALCGGSTPLPLYAAMAEQGLGVPFEQVLFFFGDERLVPATDPQNTFSAVTAALFAKTAVPAGNIHPMPVDIVPPDLAAAAYEAEMRATFGEPLGAVPRFDLILLGLGPDGHTASLFPDSPALGETTRLVAAVPPPTTAKPAVPRLTFTLPLLNAARHVLFLASAKGKEAALEKALAESPSATVPASLVRPAGDLTWLVATG